MPEDKTSACNNNDADGVDNFIDDDDDENLVVVWKIDQDEAYKNVKLWNERKLGKNG